MEEIPKEEEKISEQSSKFLFKIPSMGGKAHVLIMNSKHLQSMHPHSL